jgi:hypothetical protein
MQMLPHKKNMHVLFSVGLFCFIMGLVLCASAGYAQDRYKGEWVLPEHYPDGFNGWGRIDRLAPDEIVIDDNLYPLSPSVKYNIATSSNVRASLFRVGDTVGYLEDANGLIISLWRIP